MRHRTLNQFATVMLLVYGIGLALAAGHRRPAGPAAQELADHRGRRRRLPGHRDPRAPAADAGAMQSFAPDRAAEPRRGATAPTPTSAAGSGSPRWCGASACWPRPSLRLPLVYLLPIDVSVGATEGLLIATFVLLGGWNVWYLRQAMRRGA